MFNNNFNGQMPYGQMYTPNGFQYQNAPQPKLTQALTQEEINELRRRNDQFTLQTTPRDLVKARCCHREKNGAFTLIKNPDDTVTCTICQETFRLIDLPEEDIKEGINFVKDVMQTTKTYYVDAPEDMINTFFPMLALLDKVAPLHKIAASNFNKYDNQGMVQPQNAPYSFAMLNALTSPMGMYQQPMMNYGQPMNMGYQQPMDMNYQQQPQAPGYNNPFGYNPAPMAQQQPAPQQQPAQQPVQTDPNTTVVNSKTFNA